MTRGKRTKKTVLKNIINNYIENTKYEILVIKSKI
jgi:hypothetical protein